ncbi:hypothetical protein NHH03_14920 [Stieleria sp. TO1_6]|nr:hypothetical protein [Stieleria tagensis]
MANDLLETCAALVARLESRLQSNLTDRLFQITADDLLQSIPKLNQVVIVVESEGQPTKLASAGCAASDQTGSLVIDRCAPVTDNSRLRIELNANGRSSDTAAGVLQQTAEAVVGLLVSGLARVELQTLHQELARISDLNRQLAATADRSRQLHQVAQAMANWMNIERINLLQRVGSRYVMVASSVQARFDPRSERALATESVASTLRQQLEDRESAFLLLDCDRIPSDQRDLLSFATAGNCQRICVAEFAPADWLAIGEQFTAAGLPKQLSPAEQSTFDAALAAAQRGQRPSPRQRLSNIFVGRSNRTRLAAIAIAVAALLFLPLTVRVSADGRVVPERQHVVYAPVTGEIVRVACQPGQTVSAGQVLCEFNSHELELDASRLRGEILTVQEQLQIAATRRGDDSAGEITADRRVLEVKLQELNKQLDVVQKRREELTILSPIDGRVSMILQDDRGKISTGRPVQLGQQVIRVIDPAGGSVIELDVPDQEIGYVQRALQHRIEHASRPATDDPLRCQFRVRSQPETRYDATLGRLSETTSFDTHGRLVVVATIHPTDSTLAFAPQAGVIGWIDCDRAPAGFVLCRKLIERFRLWGWL